MRIRVALRPTDAVAALARCKKGCLLVRPYTTVGRRAKVNSPLKAALVLVEAAVVNKRRQIGAACLVHVQLGNVTGANGHNAKICCIDRAYTPRSSA
jgi:hypothetical protein